MRKLLGLAGLLVLGLLSTAAQALPCAGFTDVEDTSPFCGNVTWLKNRGITLGCTSATLYCPNDFVSRLQMAAFMNRLGDSLFPLTCAAGQVMKWDGLQWACANDAIGGGGGGGTVTSVAAGTGLQGSPNPITGAGSINLAPTYQLPQACTNGQVPKSNGAGGWACGTDTAGAGTVTSVATGTGLTGGPVTTTGTIAVNTATIQARVTGSCPAGSSIRTINADGTVTCQADAAGPANAFVQGGNAFGATGVLGTADNQPLDIRVNGTRVARYEPNATSPNVLAGHAGNSAFAGVHGATIAGGGEPTGLSGEAPNRVTDVYGTVSGGLANQAGNGAGTPTDRGYATVSGGRINTASGEYSVVAGGNNNTATEVGSVVGGGDHNHATSDLAVVGGGSVNTAAGQYATVGGGNSNDATGTLSTIGGGGSNEASGSTSTVGGGHSNRATGAGATVGGGGDGMTNLGNAAAGAMSTISGGARNAIAADGTYGAIGGGSGNQITAPAGTNLAIATIGGGQSNLVTRGGATISGGNANQATAFDATVGGGNGNNAGGGGSAIGGGVQNQAGGLRGTVPGGELNAATGDYSFAAGRRAKAVNQGCFAWGDSTNADVLCNVNDRFVVRASGGVYLYTNGAQSTGVYVAGGSGTWSSVSDRNAKANVEPVDVHGVLERVAALPISTWNYRAQESGIRHLGPMAQDFRSAFGLGENETTIATVDAQGVALAAIQGLNAKLEAALAARDGEIADLRTQIGLQREQIATQRATIAELQASRDDVAALRAAVAELLRERAGGVTRARLAPAAPQGDFVTN